MTERIVREADNDGDGLPGLDIESIEVGRIVITYSVDAEGGPIIEVERPPNGVVPLMTQLGMLEFARMDLFEFGMGLDEDGDD